MVYKVTHVCPMGAQTTQYFDRQEDEARADFDDRNERDVFSMLSKDGEVLGVWIKPGLAKAE